MCEPPRDAVTRTQILAAAVCVVSLLLAAMGTVGPSRPRTPLAPPAFVPAHVRVGTPTPSATATYYLQEGATLVQEDAIPGGTLPSVSATFRLESSSWDTGYEINGLSTTGDWYQGLAMENWPGCPSGFAFGYEVWNAAGTSVAGPICALPVVLLAGDEVQIALTLNCAGGGAGSACFTFQDLTTGLGDVVTVPQPDPTATAFENLGSVSSAVGYFTGPMTEVVDPSASSCRLYGSMPTLSYVIEAGGLTVSEYIPWSDEFGLGGKGTTLCYAQEGPIQAVDATPLTDYFNGAAGTSYGPRWEAGQNWTAVSGRSGVWRFQTDVSPLTATVLLSQSSADVGQNVTVTGTATGGVAPVTCTWYGNGITPPATTNCTWTGAASSPGVDSVTVYVVDTLSDYAQGSANLVVSPDLVVPAPTPSPAGIDIGQNVTWTATVSGGSGGYMYSWTGLPAGCSGGTATVLCVLPALGSHTVRVAVTDSNGFTALSPWATLVVSPVPTVTLLASPSTSANGGTIVFTAAVLGGHGPFTFVWSGLPPGCAGPSSAPSFSCTPTAAGDFAVTVQVTDGSGMSSTGSARVQVGQGTLGLPASNSPVVIGGISAAIVLVVAVALLLARRRNEPEVPPPRPPTMPPPPPPS